MKLPPVKYLIVLAVSLGMFIAGAAMLGYGLYKWKHHPHGPPHNIPTGRGSTPTRPSGNFSYSTTVPSTTNQKDAGRTALLFLVDAAAPDRETLNSKMKYVQHFLHSLSSKLGISTKIHEFELGVAVYYGNNVYLLSNKLCLTMNCWTDTISSLNDTLNPYNVAVHNATRGFQYVYDEFGAIDGQLGYGVKRKLVVIADGYDFTNWLQADRFADKLHDRFFSISSIVATQNTAVQKVFEACSDNFYNFYKLNRINEIENPVLTELAADWISRAYAITSTPSTTLPTKPIITTTQRQTVQPGKVPERLEPCQQYTDLVMAYHTTNAADHDTLMSFIADELIETLLGEAPTWSSSPYNLAILGYTDNTVKTVVSFKDYQNKIGYKQIVQSTSFQAPTTTQLLSNVYDEAGRMFTEQSRFYASKVLIVLTDYVDPFNAEAAKRKFDALPTSFVLGVQIATEGYTLNVPHHELLTISNYSDISSFSSLTRRQYGNSIANYASEAPSTTTTMATITIQPPAVEPREVWPDIAVLIDVSSAVTSKDFETIRQFLRITLNKYYITPRTTRVSLALFNSEVVVKGLFNTIDSFEKLQAALGEKLQLGAITPSPVRDLTKALSEMLSTVYVETISDYNMFKENFLWIFLSGSPSDNNYLTPLRRLQKMGVRTEAIGLGTEIDNWHLSQFGYTSFQVSRWDDDNEGIIADGDDLSNQVFQMSTNRRTQPLSQINSDFYFVVDQSSALSDADFKHIQNFLQSFISMLTVDSLHCGVSILPFDDGIKGGLTLSYSYTEVEEYLSQMKYSNANNANSNLGKTVSELKQSFLKRNSRANHIIFIVGATSSSGAEGAQAALSSEGYVFVIGLNSNIGYAKQLTSDEHIFLLNDTSSLEIWVEDVHQKTIWNPMTHFFIELADEQENYMQSHLIPFNELTADFVFAIDLTLVSNQTFPIIKTFILEFAKMLTIGPNNAQIAAHCYTNQNSVEDGFHFWEVKNYSDLQKMVNSLSLETNDISLPSDIAGAYIDIADYILQAKNGWREGPTYVITLSTATSLLNNEQMNEEARRKMFAKAQALGLNMDGQDDVNTGFLRLFAPDYYAVVPSVDQLSISANYTKELFNKLDKLYKSYNFPEPPPFESIVADFVFVIDHSAELTSNHFTQALALIRQLIEKATILPQNSRVGIISYDSFGIIDSDTITMNKYLNQQISLKDELIQGIEALSFRNDPFPSNLSRVMEYICDTNSGFGLRPNVPAIITLFAASSRISDYIPPRMTAALNARRLTYAFEISDLPYISQFLGEHSNIQITEEFQLNNIYIDFITNGKATFQECPTTTIVQQPGYVNGNYTYIARQQATYPQQYPCQFNAYAAAPQTTYHERSQQDDCSRCCCTSLAALLCGCIIGECTDSNVCCCLIPCPPLPRRR
uniref:VWFA domain-containing protein n=1 Tax=Syphacia muris TaxID=451379 RepID=A0A0N5AQL0_9BILA